MLTVAQASARLGITPGRVRQLIIEKKIKAEKLSDRVLLVDEAEVERYKAARRAGRPRKGAKAR